MKRGISRLMLQRMACFVRRHADSRNRITMKILGGKKKLLLCRVVMVRQMSGDFTDRHIIEASRIENLARGLGTREPVLRRNPNVLAVRRTQPDLGVNAQKQSRNYNPPIMTEPHSYLPS